MEDGRYFKKALVSFASDAAYAGAVKHLYDAGLSVGEIKKNLSYPVSEEKIKKVIRDYEKERGSAESAYEYVQDVDAYGRKSFRLAKKK